MWYLIDKPSGMTSFDVIRVLKKKLNTSKIWHTGTLDPLATGCLMIATDESTKLISLLSWIEKRYYFECRIDATTPSLDLGTHPLEHSIDLMKNRTNEELREFLTSMKSQIPPKYSALHIDWVRAYTLARKWADFNLRERNVALKDIEIITFDPPFFWIRLTISSWGYIRSIADDIGKFFGLPGGYITLLRREALIAQQHVIGTLSQAQEITTFDPTNSLDESKIFSWIHQESISSEIAEKIQQWLIPYNFCLSKSVDIWQNILLYQNDNLISLIEFWENGFRIIKNNLSRSHKIRRD